MEETQLHAMIGNIYELCLDPSRTPDVGRIIEQALGIGSSIHFVSESGTGRMTKLLSASDNFDAGARRDYATHYHDRNVWFQRAQFHAPPYVRRGEELIDAADFLRTEFCSDWCPRVDIFHMIGCTYSLPGGMVGGSGVHRTRRQGPFSDADKQLYALLMGHFARAVGLAHQFGNHAQETECAVDIVDALNLGVILLHADRRVVHANRVAEKALARRDWITVVDGRLRSVHHGSLGLLSWHIAAAAQTGAGKGRDAGKVLRLRAADGDTLVVLITPFRGHADALSSLQPTAALIFNDPEAQNIPRATAIATAYGLSAAEGRLVALIAAGKNLTEAANCAGISYNTAKTQLKSVFAKTQFKRQADLVADVRANSLMRLSGQ
jgi:DNA-binding CsgD family transcriptional regulator